MTRISYRDKEIELLRNVSFSPGIMRLRRPRPVTSDRVLTILSNRSGIRKNRLP